MADLAPAGSRASSPEFPPLDKADAASQGHRYGQVKPRLAARALILHEDRLLLVNAYPGAHLGLWCAPGGGCEAGQSLPENLAREVMRKPA
jgi:8-oxo-dGTP pyrophosphatase MutT (NUDIX family)